MHARLRRGPGGLFFPGERTERGTAKGAYKQECGMDRVSLFLDGAGIIPPCPHRTGRTWFLAIPMA